jgi:hypothetical protein
MPRNAFAMSVCSCPVDHDSVSFIELGSLVMRNGAGDSSHPVARASVKHGLPIEK